MKLKTSFMKDKFFSKSKLSKIFGENQNDCMSNSQFSKMSNTASFEI